MYDNDDTYSAFTAFVAGILAGSAILLIVYIFTVPAEADTGDFGRAECSGKTIPVKVDGNIYKGRACEITDKP